MKSERGRGFNSSLTGSVGAVLVVVGAVLHRKRPEGALLLRLAVGAALSFQLLHVLERTVDPLTLWGGGGITRFMVVKTRNGDERR